MLLLCSAPHALACPALLYHALPPLLMLLCSGSMLPLLTSLLALAALIAHRASLLMLLLSVELSSAALY